MYVRTALILLFSASALSGCGYSEEEWQMQLDKYNRLNGEHQATQDKLGKTGKELADTKQRVAILEKELAAAGVDIGKLNENLQQTSTELNKMNLTLQEQERALAQYKERARQLDQIKARFELLRKKLDDLTKLGLAVNIRRNRMVISLPGDVLFDSGQDTLKKEGREILDKVAGVIKADKTLTNRDYQVAGHTDNVAMSGGGFRDNWGLSLMRARGVLLYLIDPKTGGLPTTRWSAAGFADTDPVASNESKEGKQQNRRCDLIVVPSVEEMIDIKEVLK